MILCLRLPKIWKQMVFNAVLVTADKDMGQALTDTISLYDYFKDQLLSKSALEEKLGFSSQKLPFYYALLGDASDNIPGVAGIGTKTAQELVEQFDSLEDLYNRVDTIANARAKKALLAHREDAFLSYQLFLLRYVKLGLSPEQLAFNPAQWSMARSLFLELEFKSLLQAAELPKEQQQAIIEQKIAGTQKEKF